MNYKTFTHTIVVGCMLTGISLMAYVDYKQDELNEINNTEVKTCSKSAKKKKCAKKV
jgi:hypothetical protein